MEESDGEYEEYTVGSYLSLYEQDEMSFKELAQLAQKATISLDIQISLKSYAKYSCDWSNGGLGVIDQRTYIEGNQHTIQDQNSIILENLISTKEVRKQGLGYNPNLDIFVFYNREIFDIDLRGENYLRTLVRYDCKKREFMQPIKLNLFIIPQLIGHDGKYMYLFNVKRPEYPGAKVELVQNLKEPIKIYKVNLRDGQIIKLVIDVRNQIDEVSNRIRFSDQGELSGVRDGCIFIKNFGINKLLVWDTKRRTYVSEHNIKDGLYPADKLVFFENYTLLVTNGRISNKITAFDRNCKKILDSAEYIGIKTNFLTPNPVINQKVRVDRRREVLISIIKDLDLDIISVRFWAVIDKKLRYYDIPILPQIPNEHVVGNLQMTSAKELIANISSLNDETMIYPRGGYEVKIEIHK